MFTINIYLKFAIIAVCLIGGTILAFLYGFWYAFPFFLIGLIFLVSYIMLGTVQSAAQIMEKQDFEATEKRLNLTFNPKFLYVTNRSYYYILKGSVAMGKEENKKAKEYFNKANSLKLPSDNERAMVKLQLAGIYAKTGNWNKVKGFMKEIKSLNVTQSMIVEQVDLFNKSMKQRSKNPQMMRQARKYQGGKRRRPKRR